MMGFTLRREGARRSGVADAAGATVAEVYYAVGGGWANTDASIAQRFFKNQLFDFDIV